MPSPQSLDDTNRRLVAAWAADCAEHVVDLFELEAPDDDRPRDAIARLRAYSWGEIRQVRSDVGSSPAVRLRRPRRNPRSRRHDSSLSKDDV